MIDFCIEYALKPVQAKGLYVSETENLRLNSLTVGMESSTDASASASDSELLQETKDMIQNEFKVIRGSEAVKGTVLKFKKYNHV